MRDSVFGKPFLSRPSLHSRWHLPLILLLAAVLRLWNLAAKPLWVDELYTGFYSLGKSLDEIPLNTLLSPQDYWSLLDTPGTPWQAAQVLTLHSNHPPLFFMAMNRWLAALGTSVWSLRAFAGLWGVVAVAGMFYLGRRVAGPQVGKLAALLMAVSPYGIYLSQDARHYSLAVAIAIFSLVQWIALLQGKRSPWRWLTWISLNALGLYVHYFYSFCPIAQGLITLGRMLWRRERGPWLLAMAATALLYVPWFPTAVNHFQGDSGTSWLSQSTPLWQTLILPWLQSLVAGVFMVVMLPVEQMPLAVTIGSALIMLTVFGVMMRQVWQGAKKEPLLTVKSPVVAYGAVVFGIMMAITYGLGKDLTLAPRYFFMLYPAVTLLLALGLRHRRVWVWGVAIAAGLISQLLIAQDIALLKPYLPGQVGRRLATADLVLVSPQQPSYRARSLSYILAIPPNNSAIQVAFTESASTDQWQPNLSSSDTLPSKELTLWLVEPKRPTPFPETVVLPDHTCRLQGDLIKTEGTRQQTYQCQPTPSQKG